MVEWAYFGIVPHGVVNFYIYGNDIPDTYVCLYAGHLGNDFVLQNGNAKSRRARNEKDHRQHQKFSS